MELAADGSCTKQALRCLRRAAWAIALLRPESEDVLAVLRGPVAGSLPQTPAFAEHLAYALAGQVSDRETHVGLDCLAVVTTAQRSLG
eukprot:1724837-Pyramimonas_sp.AAC.1